MGCDLYRQWSRTFEFWFQSTHPGWGATTEQLKALYETSRFNPRTPGGVRQCSITLTGVGDLFQSTHPGWGATHLPAFATRCPTCFNPRTPGGVRLSSRCTTLGQDSFNPRTPGGVRLYKKERAESQGNMWYVLRTYWCGFPLNKLSDFSFKLSS